MRLLVTCECGKEFPTTQNRQDAGRGVYCSKPCMYRYRHRPSGLTYNIKVKNRGWFQEGHTPWSKGNSRTDLHKERPGYDAIHKWVSRWADDPCKCENCGSTNSLEWSNKSNKYLRDLSDWQRLCRKCHMRYDYETFGARKAFYE